MALAGELGRSGRADSRAQAITLLKALAERYPYALAIRQELVFVMMEANEDVELILHRLEREFANLDEETLCRWGRLFKEKGDGLARTLQPDQAERYYRKSLEKYDRAYRIRDGHYPAINKATLLLIVGSLRPLSPGASEPSECLESAKLAEKILTSRGSWRAELPADEAIWFPATEAEAHLLRREWAEAAVLYRHVLDQDALNPHSRATMHRQVERILSCFRNLNVPPAPPFDDPGTLFGAEAGLDPLASS